MKGAGEDWANRQSPGGGLAGETGGGVFRVPDRYLPEILDAPEVAVLADRAQEEAGDGERLGNHLGDPAIKPPEMEVGRTVGQQPRLDRSQVVVEEEERDSVRGVKRP